MTDPTPTRRSFRPTPAWLIFGLLVVEGLLWLSERFQWFWFNEQKGWTVLIAVAVVGVACWSCCLVRRGLVFRWRFQFSIRSLLVLVVAVAVPCSWLAVEMKRARGKGRRWRRLGNWAWAATSLMIGSVMRVATHCQSHNHSNQGGCGICSETISSRRLWKWT